MVVTCSLVLQVSQTKKSTFITTTQMNVRRACSTSGTPTVYEASLGSKTTWDSPPPVGTATSTFTISTAQSKTCKREMTSSTIQSKMSRCNASARSQAQRPSTMSSLQATTDKSTITTTRPLKSTLKLWFNSLKSQSIGTVVRSLVVLETQGFQAQSKFGACLTIQTIWKRSMKCKPIASQLNECG